MGHEEAMNISNPLIKNPEPWSYVNDLSYCPLGADSVSRDELAYSPYGSKL